MKKLIKIILIASLLFLFFIIEARPKIDLFFFTLEKPVDWSIGVFSGRDPFHLHPLTAINNPVLTAQDVSDVSASFVADPFLVREGDNFYMFFEVLNSNTSQGDIGLAESKDGLNWIYRQIVLDESFHLSYPYVFKFENQYYMIPESHKANGIRLYKAEKFPTKWSYVSTLITGIFLDPTPFRFDSTWWIFAGGGKHDTLYIFYSQNLSGPWQKHPMNPAIRKNPNRAQPAGRILKLGSRIIRYAQDAHPYYGNQLRAFEISLLTTKRYSEREIMMDPILKGSGRGWNADGMHHIDYNKISEKSWIAIVDGFRFRKVPRFHLKASGGKSDAFGISR